MQTVSAIKKILSKSWVRAILIAAPITVTFGYVALIGFLLGLLQIYDVYFSSDSWRNQLRYVNWWMMISGISGLLGIAGIWLRLIFQKKLTESMGRLNWIVCGLLSIGVFGLFWGNFGLGFIFTIRNFQDFLFLSANFSLAAYGGWLAYTTVKPKR